MRFTLGFSPCPNDTFIFDALVNGKIDTGPYQFDVVLEDVQTLNEWALQGKLDISKISYGVLPLITERYQLLNSGGALGEGVGPLLITKTPTAPEVINNMRIAIPGQNTTAHLLFSLAYPNAKNKVFKVFHEIESAVLSGEVAAGVIIHENRFTYAQKGLYKVMDLGDHWEQVTGSPIPLGGIVVRKDIDTRIAKELDALISASVDYAFQHHYDVLADYVTCHAQEMEPAVMRQHIDLYVNDYSRSLGAKGQAAVQTLLQVYQQQHPDTQHNTEVFLTKL